MTLSEAFVLPGGGGMPNGSPERAVDEAQVDAHARAMVAVTVGDGKISRVKAFLVEEVAAVRTAWWTPDTLPTVAQAWANRFPDRTAVPGDNAALYYGWVVYNHGLALPAVAAVTAAIGLLSVTAWLLFHPARFVLASTITAALAALIG